MAGAFQPTETGRPATKQSPAVFDRLAERKPIHTVAATVMNENARIHGSTSPRTPRGSEAGRCVLAQRALSRA